MTAPAPRPATRPASTQGDAATQGASKPRVQRVVACVLACIGTCVVAGGVHGALILTGVWLGDAGFDPTSLRIGTLLSSVFGGVLLGGIFGVGYGVLAGLPFAAVVFRRRLLRSCAWLLGCFAAVSVAAAVLVALGASGRGSEGDLVLVVLALFGFPVVALGLGLLVIAWRVPTSWTPYPLGCCQSCGYDRAGIDESAPCPECGAAPMVGRVS